jgi:hypothetical protein
MSTQEISARIQAFARDLEQLVQSEAIAAVHKALGGSAPRPAVAASKPAVPAKRIRATRKRATRKVAAKAAAKPSAPTPADVKLLAHVKSHPGLRVEALAKALGVASPKLKDRVAALVTSKALRKEGKTRGTTYFIA